MKHHLKEQQILDYLFGLSEPSDGARTEQHLAECADCRKHADLLRQRFATLEMLRGAEEASERLISNTLRRVRTDQPAREARFPTFAWLTGAAAAAALLLAVFVVAPKIGREPAVELAKVEAPPARAEEPLGEGMNQGMAAAPQPAAAPAPVEPPVGALLAESGPMIGAEIADHEEALRAADEVLSDAADRPPAPVLAMAREFSAGARSAAELDEAPATESAATARIKPRAKRVRKTAPAATRPYAARLPRGWSYAPTNEVRVMLIPLKSKADGLIAPPAEGFRTRYWQVRVLNEATNTQVVSVTRAFDRPGWSLQLLNAEGRLARQTDLDAVIEADVPAGGFRAVRCMISEPLEEKSP